MVRSQALLGVAFGVLSSVVAFAADYPDTMRGSFPSDWSNEDMTNPISIEGGLRYWYSMGQHQMTASGGGYSANDTSHILEGHFRINDSSTNSYAKGQVGIAAAINGDYSTPSSGGTQNISSGNIGYAGADLGFLPFGAGGFRLGGFAGYQYMNESPNMGRTNFVTATGGGNSVVNNLEFHTLRLGLAGRADIAEKVDLNVELAGIPYAKLSGTYGAYSSGNFVVGPTTFQQGSAGTIEGALYGAAGEAMIGFHPTDNLVLRIGGRASYLTGPATMSFTAADTLDATNRADFIETLTAVSFLRYGLLAELTGKF
jgi:hypothetical protein